MSVADVGGGRGVVCDLIRPVANVEEEWNYVELNEVVSKNSAEEATRDLSVSHRVDLLFGFCLSFLTNALLVVKNAIDAGWICKGRQARQQPFPLRSEEGCGGTSSRFASSIERCAP